ncbi:hypothetical protein [Lacticaseibacillus sp. GG6-2]
MKKIVTGLLVSATVLGFALTTTSNVHAAEKTDASNNATLQVDAGTLSMTAPASQKFGSTSVETVYNDGFSKTVADGTGTTISDFLGDNADQQVTVMSKDGWSDKNMNADRASTLTITPSTQDKATVKQVTVTNQPASIATVNAGKTAIALEYELKIAQGTGITASTETEPTTNTLTWSVGNVPDGDPE